MNFLNLDETHFISITDYKNMNKRKSCSYPMVVVNDFGWKATTHQVDVNLENEIKVDMNTSINIFMEDIDELIDKEELFRVTYRETQAFANFSDEYCGKNATLSLDENKEISHSNTNIQNLYKLEVYFKITDFIKEKEVINPVKIELDKNIQREVMEHLSLVNSIWKGIYELRSNLDVESDKGEYDNCSQQLKALEKQAKSVYNFANISKTDMTLEKYSFITCFNLMKEKQIDISKASEIIQKDVEEQKSKRDYIEKTYTQKGDEALNKYTDIIVESIRENVLTEYPITIYGGSTLMRFYYDDKMGDLKYPIIIVSDDVNYNLENKTYTTQNSDGEMVYHKYTINALPIIYGIKIFILTENQEQLKEIEEKIQEAYKEENTFSFLDPIYKNETYIFKVSIDTEEQIEHSELNEKDKLFYRSIIKFKKYPNVYYLKFLAADNIKNDLRLQQRQIQLAEFFLNAYNKIEKSMIRELDRLKKLLIPREKSKSILGGLGRKIGDNLLQTAEYKQLKYSVDNYLPLDRKIFEKEFSGIIEYYPNLYPEVTGNRSVQEIKERMIEYQKEISTRYSTICNKLNIPGTISGFQSGSGCDAKALRFYADEMSRSFTRTLDECISQYKGVLEYNKRRDEEWDEEWAEFKGQLKEDAERRQEARERRQEARESRNDNKNGGIEIKNYFGKPACQRVYGKKVRSCVGCTMAPYCTSCR